MEILYKLTFLGILFYCHVVRSEDVCVQDGRTYHVGEYLHQDLHCKSCRCHRTFDGAKIVCVPDLVCELGKRKRKTSDSNFCTYNGQRYKINSYPVIGNCVECRCELGTHGPHVNCINLCEFGKRKRSAKSRSFRRYDTPPPFTTAPMTTTPSPPPFTTRTPPPPPTTNGPGKPHYMDSGTTHGKHSTRSPPPPNIYHSGLG